MTVAATKTKAEQALSQNFEAVAAQAAGRPRRRRSAQGRHRRLCGARAAASAHRGMEVHRPARGPEGGVVPGCRRRGQGAGAGDRRGAGDAGRARCLSRRVRRRRACARAFDRWPAPRAWRSRRWRRRLPSPATMPAWPDRRERRRPGSRDRAQHRVHDGRRHRPHRQGRRARQAAAPRVRPLGHGRAPRHHAQYRRAGRRRPCDHRSRPMWRCRARRRAKPIR